VIKSQKNQCEERACSQVLDEEERKEEVKMRCCG
jgi:hypothetical protein